MTVSGKVVLPQKTSFAEKDVVVIGFVPEAAGKGTVNPKFNGSDQSFVTSEIVPGKYKVTVQISPYPDPESKQRQPAIDALNKQFGQVDKTKLTYEVTNDAKQTITLDMGKGEVTKN